MRVTVQLFARLRELAGRGDWEFDVPAGAAVADVWRAVTERHPALAAFSSSISAARNDDFARMTAPVHEGDTIAFLPPVSGGTAMAARATARGVRGRSPRDKR